MSETQNLPATIQADSNGLLKPQNLDEAWRMAKYYVASKILPERYNTPEMVLTAMQFALELGLRPLTALRQIAVVKGTPTVFGDLPLSMAYASGKLVNIKEIYLDKDMNEISFANKNLKNPIFAAYCRVIRAGDSEPLETYFSLDDANRANLLGSPTWKNYPQYMLRYRARSQALKGKFPDALNGISIGEYDHNMREEDIINVTPSPIAAGPSASVASGEPSREAEGETKRESLRERLARQKAETQVESVVIEAETIN